MYSHFIIKLTLFLKGFIRLKSVDSCHMSKSLCCMILFKAICIYRSGVEILDHNPKAHFNFGNYLKDVGKREEAIMHYMSAVRLEQVIHKGISKFRLQ